MTTSSNQWQMCSSSWFTNCAVTSNICFKVRLSWFLTKLWIVEKFFAMNVTAFNVVAMNIPYNIECSVHDSAMLDILFCLFRTLSLTWFTNSVASLPMTKFSKWVCSCWCTDTVFPRSIVNSLSVPCRMRISAEKRFLTMRVNFLQWIPRIYLRFPRSIVLRSSTFRLLRRPRSTKILL